MSILQQVTFEHIRRLSDAQLTNLLLRLLNLEALKNGIPLSDVRVPLNITIGDGGEDGRIKWSDGIEKTDNIPSRFSIFQVKATGMGPEKCKAELFTSTGEIKPKIKSVASENGAYVIFCQNNAQDIDKNIKKIREGLKEGGIANHATLTVEFYDAERIASWVNQYPQAAIYVAECSVGISFDIGLKTWDGLNTRIDFQGKFEQYFTTEKIKSYLSLLQEQASKERSVTRIIGLPGLGKTRMIFEAFRVIDATDQKQTLLKEQFFYYDAKITGNQLPAFFSELITNKYKGTLFIDNCDLELHKKLCEEVKRIDSKLNLITSDFNPEERYRATEIEIIKLTPDDFQPIILEQLKHLFPGLPEMDLQRIEELVQGFPAMAVNLGQDRMDRIENIGELNDDDLLEKLLWGRGEGNEDEKKILRACAVFQHFGFYDEYEAQRNFIASHPNICSLTGNEQEKCDKFFDICVKFVERGILQRQGRYLFVRPKPLAIRLAADWWRRCRPEIVSGLLADVTKVGLANQLCDQIAKLDFLPAAKDITKQLCGDNSPFGQAEVLNTEEGSRLFRSLVEVNPEATTNTLVRLYGTKSIDELKKVDKGRRNLVWALEKLCFRQVVFSKASKIMFAFAVAENETWGNNATSQFLQLFQPTLSGTQANLNERFTLIEFGLNHKESAYRELAMDALARGLSFGHSTRMGGAEKQGSGMALEDNMPTKGEAHEYWRKILEHLKVIALNEPERNEIVRSQIQTHIRGLCYGQAAYLLIPVLNEMIDKFGNNWPELLSSLKQALKFEGGWMSDTEREGFKELIARLTPSLEDFAYSYDIIVGTPRFEDVDDSSDFYERSINKSVDLAEYYVKSVHDKDKYLSIFVRGDQQYAHHFGKKVCELIGEDEITVFFAKLVKEAGEAPADKRNVTILAGIIAGVKDDTRKKVFTDTIVNDPVLYEYAFSIVCSVDPSLEIIYSLFQLIDAGKRPIGSFTAFKYGRALDHLEIKEVIELSERIASYSKEGQWTALSILYMFCHSNANNWNECKQTIQEILSTPGFIQVERQMQSLEFYNWQDSVSKLLKEGNPTFAEFIAKEILAFCDQAEFFLAFDSYIQNALILLLENYFEVVWPVISQGLLSDKEHYYVFYHLKQMLGSHIGGMGNETGILFRNNLDEIYEWCQSNQPLAPIRIANMAPIFHKENNNITWHPFTRRIIDNFGQDEKVRKEISANMGTYSWTGSIVPLLKSKQKLFRDIENHPITEVSIWATQNLEWLEEQIRQERNNDAEWFIE